MNSDQNKKRALVLEGGGMRSAYVAGALLAFHELGKTRFDVIIGTSAGACCAANFLVGHPEYNQFVLEEHLASERFIKFGNILTPKNIVDVDYLLDECFDTFDKIQNHLKTSNTKFFITTTNCSNGEPIFMDASKENIREALRASCAMPYLYRKKVFRSGDRVIDGGLSSSIPIRKAIKEGCDEIYAVCSRPQGYRKKPNSFGWINHLAFPKYPHLARALWFRDRAYNADLDLLENPPRGVDIIAIRPKEKLPVSRVTRDRIKVRRGIQQGFYDAYQVLSGRSFTYRSGGPSDELPSKISI
jgi:predicted patatin/cPLA2 family phospholipase